MTSSQSLVLASLATALLLVASAALAQGVEFDEVDLNNDGYLDATELLAVFDIAGLSLMSQDRNGDAVVSRSELQETSRDLEGASSEPQNVVPAVSTATGTENSDGPAAEDGSVRQDGSDQEPVGSADTVGTNPDGSTGAGGGLGDNGDSGETDSNGENGLSQDSNDQGSGRSDDAKPISGTTDGADTDDG